MRKLEREVVYPTGDIDDGQNGFSEGLRLSMPTGYDELGRYRKRPVRVPWGVVMFVGVLVCCLVKVWA